MKWVNEENRQKEKEKQKKNSKSINRITRNSEKNET